MPLRRHPLVYEINTAVWLETLSRRYGHTMTLDVIPEEVIEELAGWHFDAIWLMGVWERSPRGREVALNHIGLQEEYRHALPGYRPEQVLGSPYAVHRYTVDPRFGGREALASLRERLAHRGIRLILDYVPNHVAVDHPWTTESPGALIRATREDLMRAPGEFFAVKTADGKEQVFANGRDPYFPPWTDTAQIDAFSEEARQRTRETILDIASQCDGVRCDMVMLMVSKVFAGTWKRQNVPPVEFWRDVIPYIKTRHPEFTFMAEVYWGMEGELQALGFDFTYDKLLYDRTRHEPGFAIRDHLLASLNYRQRMVLFVENHDEARALAGFGPRWQPAATLAATLPGMALFYQGQFEGRRIKLPVQLGAAPDEAFNGDVQRFYRHLMTEVHAAPYHDGIYMMLAAHPAPGHSKSDAHEHVIAYAWALGDDWRIVAVSFADRPISARLMLPRPDLLRGAWRFENALNPGESFLRAGESVLNEGFPLDLGPFGAKIYRAVRV